MQKQAWQRCVCGFKSKPYGTISRGSMTKESKIHRGLETEETTCITRFRKTIPDTTKPQRVDQHFHRLQVAIGFRIKYKK